MARTNTKQAQAVEAAPYVAPRGNKAMAKASTAKAIAAQHAAFATRNKAGVPIADYALRVTGVGGDLRFAGWGVPDATYSTGNANVHTYRHTSALPKGAGLSCDALHRAGGPCSATSANLGIDLRTWRNDGEPELARVLDNETTLVEAASGYFAIALRNAIAQGYNDAARLLVTPGIAQLLAHPRHGAAMRAVFAKATKAPAPKAARAPRVRATPTPEAFVRTEAEQVEAEGEPSEA